MREYDIGKIYLYKDKSGVCIHLNDETSFQLELDTKKLDILHKMRYKEDEECIGDLAQLLKLLVKKYEDGDVKKVDHVWKIRKKDGTHVSGKFWYRRPPLGYLTKLGKKEDYQRVKYKLVEVGTEDF